MENKLWTIGASFLVGIAAVVADPVAQARASSVYVTLDSSIVKVPGHLDQFGRPVVKSSRAEPQGIDWPPDDPHWDSFREKFGYDPRNFVLDKKANAVIQLK